MILCGVIDQQTAISHIDFNTLGLLIGMMIIVNITSETGLFNFLAIWAAKKVKARPIALLVALHCSQSSGSIRHARPHPAESSRGSGMSRPQRLIELSDLQERQHLTA